MTDGGFAEYVKVPKEFLFHAPKNVSMEDCTLIDSFAFASRTIKLSNIGKKENIVILGGGSIGLCTLKMVISEKDPNYVLVVEPHEFLREKSKEMGATEAVPPVMSKIKRFLKRNGEPTFVFICANHEDTIMMAINILKKGGFIILESVFKGNISFPIFMINSKELTLKGIISHNREDILAAIELIEKKKIIPSDIISEIVPLKDIQKTFERFLEPGERKFIKILVKM